MKAQLMVAGIGAAFAAIVGGNPLPVPDVSDIKWNEEKIEPGLTWKYADGVLKFKSRTSALGRILICDYSEISVDV